MEKNVEKEWTMSRKQLERRMAKKYGAAAAKKHFDHLAKVMAETPINEENTPGGGYCTSCERYDCGHFLNAKGEVLLSKHGSGRN